MSRGGRIVGPPPLAHHYQGAGGAQGPIQTVQVIEPIVGPWRGGKGWAGRFQGELPAEGESIFLANVDALPGPPRPLTIHLIRNDRNSGSFSNSAVRARITYGMGGVANVFSVDWLSGGQFSIVANSVRVEAVAYRPVPNAPYATNENVVLGVMLGQGACAAAFPPTYTTEEQNIQGLNNGAGPQGNLPNYYDWPIPDFARRVMPYISGQSHEGFFEGMKLQFRTRGLTDIAEVPPVYWVIPGAGSGALIPGHAAFVRLYNSNDVFVNPEIATVNAGLIFELGL